MNDYFSGIPLPQTDQQNRMRQTSTILIVDDEEVGRDILEGLLIKEGYELAFAANGQQAVEKATELTPDLILLDVMLPGMDGYQVCQHLRTDKMLAEVPIIMVTALNDRESRLRGIEAGADDFISKPFNRLELQSRVRTITRLNRYRRLLSERALRQQAIEAEQLKTRFISNVSHELRTPLSIITLLSGNLDRRYHQVSDEKRQQMIRDIREQARTLSELVENVLEIGHLDTDQAVVERNLIDLASVIFDEVERQRPLAQRKAQKLQITGDEPLPVWGNEPQLHQVVGNLLNNAIKYTPASGEIRCEFQAVRLGDKAVSKIDGWPGGDTLSSGNWACLRVVDNGIGIPEEAMPYLFERFYRVNSQSETSGTGLGLAIVSELLERHQGHIAVSTVPAGGSIFAIYLPLLEEEPK